jgi:hypothetical protein
VVLPAGDNVVRLLPPLTLSESEAREGIELLNKTAAQMESQKAAAPAPARDSASGGGAHSTDQVRRAEGAKI